MYRPAYSRNEDQKLALQLIKEYPLGILISRSSDKINTGYLPFIISEIDQQVFLFSHLAKANPLWQNVDGEVIISFQGPQSYISPTIYVNKMNVPTWSS